MAGENNIGASRLLRSDNTLQQAADSLTSQISRIASQVGIAASTLFNANSRANANTGNSWNNNYNRTLYSNNGGGGRFSAPNGPMGGGRSNGGGGSFGPTVPGSRLSAGLAATAGVASAFTQYANRNMSSNMQMDFFGTQSAISGGFSGNVQNASATARALAFNNNYVALNANDAAKAAYINQYTFGNSQFNGAANPMFVSGMRQANAFGYASPTLGASGAATAAQQTYSARATMVAPALGLASPILAGGQKNSMSAIAQSIYSRTFGSQRLNSKQLDAALQQGGSLNVNLQYFGQALGWNQDTIQEYQNVLRGQVAAQNKGMSTGNYYNLLSQAGAGNKTAINTLAKTTGMGSSMFENQRDLNATRLTRQNDILNSLAPAFDSATKTVNKFSGALTSLMQATGLDKIVGTGAGVLSPFSNSLSGFGGTFGAASGALGAARLFGFGGAGGAGRAAGASNIIAGSGASTLSRATSIAGATGILGLAATVVGNKTSQMDPALIQKLIKDGSKRSTFIDGVGGGGNAASTGGGGSIKATGTNGGANAAEVIGFAEQQLGDPYVWGGTGPNGWDCSGLIQWAYGKAGVKIPRVASDQQKQGKPVPTDAVQPGDLLFNGNPAHHVVMAIGGGKIIEAPHTGANVRIRSFKPGEFTDARRILGSIGNMSSLLNGSTDNNTNTLNNQQSKSGGDIGGSFGGTSELEAIMSALSGSTGGGPVPLSASSGSTGSVAGNPSPTGQVKGTGSNKASSLQAYAKKLLGQYGWSGQWSQFNSLEMSEAGWNPTATNPQSGAYGLAQALPEGKYASAGSDWKTSGETQLRWMMGYIKDRYGDPAKAWSFHQRNNWYAAGAWNIDKDQNATVHQGEMIIPAQQAETIRQTLLNNSFNPNMNKGTATGAPIQFGDINVVLPGGYSGTPQEAKTTGKMIVDAMNERLRIENLKVGQ